MKERELLRVSKGFSGIETPGRSRLGSRGQAVSSEIPGQVSRNKACCSFPLSPRAISTLMAFGYDLTPCLALWSGEWSRSSSVQFSCSVVSNSL